MQKPVCTKCQRFYKPEKNGYYFLEGMPSGPWVAEPGTAHPEQWKPYKLWCGDLWKCHGCQHTIIIGALHPIAEHFEFDFAKTVRVCAGDSPLQVNDC